MDETKLILGPTVYDWETRVSKQNNKAMKNHAFQAIGTMIVLALSVLEIPAQSTYEPYTFTTLAGGGGFNSPDTPGDAIRFNSPGGAAVDSAGTAYVADTHSHAIRKVTSAGVVTTLAGMPGSAGSADGTGSDAGFNSPNGVAVDSAGNVYVADQGNHTIRKVTPDGTVTTLAGLAGSSGSANGTNSTARFWGPNGVAVDSAGNVYVADSSNGTIRKITPVGTDWVVKTLAGRADIGPGSTDGTNSAALFNYPYRVTVDGAGNLYVADTDNHTVRKMQPVGTDWVVTTLAGLAGNPGSANGTNRAARFKFPFGIAVDNAENVYVADTGNQTIRRVTPVGTNWVVTTLAGLTGWPGSANGTNSSARFSSPFDVALDGSGTVYVVDGYNDLIRKGTPVGTNWVVSTMAGVGGNSGNLDGVGNAALFAGPAGVTVDSAGNVYVADQVNYTIRKVTPAGEVTTLAGLAGYGGRAIAGSDGRFNFPQGVAVDTAGNVYVVNRGNSTIQKVTPAGAVTTLAGLAGTEDEVDGLGSAARFVFPKGVAVDRAGNLYVADTIASTIRKVTPTGTVTTLAGLAFDWSSADGTGSAARFNFPGGVAVDTATNLYVADTGNHTIRKVTPSRVVTTLAGLAGSPGSADGNGNAARFNYPSGIAVDSVGNIYVADTFNNTIRKLKLVGTNWVVTTLGGMPDFYGTADGTGNTARFSNPNGVAVDSAGNLYVADFYFNTIRKGFPAPRILNSGVVAGRFGFDLTGPTGRSVVIEASTELVNWLPVWTNTFEGPLNFIDPQSGISPNRFYRTRLP